MFVSYGVSDHIPLYDDGNVTSYPDYGVIGIMTPDHILSYHDRNVTPRPDLHTHPIGCLTLAMEIVSKVSSRRCGLACMDGEFFSYLILSP